jgi:hypothetical protein
MEYAESVISSMHRQCLHFVKIAKYFPRLVENRQLALLVQVDI